MTITDAAERRRADEAHAALLALVATAERIAVALERQAALDPMAALDAALREGMPAAAAPDGWYLESGGGYGVREGDGCRRPATEAEAEAIRAAIPPSGKRTRR